MKLNIPLWKKQYNLFPTPYRVGGNSNIHLVNENKNLICKVCDSKKALRDINGLLKVKQNSISPEIKDIFYNSKNNCYYYFMKKYSNDLFDVITNQNTFLSLKEIVLISYILTHKINKMHSLYIAHRDLKPENIVLDIKNYKINFSSIKIIDYDASCHTQYPDTLQKYGTQIYDPPEKNLISQYNWISGDIYSLGLIKCLLFTRGLYNIDYFRFPINNSLLYEMIISNNNQCNTYNYYKNIDEYCKLLCLMINKDPLKRPSLTRLLQFYQRNCYL